MKIDLKIARNLSFRHLRSFVCLAHTGSFTRAAKQMSMSQPAFTLNIRQFEDIVGVELLTRTTRSVALTEHGRYLLPRIERILGDFDTSVFETRAKAQQTANQVKIAVLPSVAIRMLPVLIRDFGNVTPEVSIQMNDDNGRGVQSQILNCEADFGISSVWCEHPKLEFTPLLCDRVGLICHANHPLAKTRNGLNWSNLIDYDFVGMAEDTGVHQIIHTDNRLPETVISPAHSVLTIAALVGLLENGSLVSALPALAAPDYLNPALVYRGLSKPEVYRQLGIMTLRGRTPSPAAAAFIDFLKEKVDSISSMFPNNTVVSGSEVPLSQ